MNLVLKNRWLRFLWIGLLFSSCVHAAAPVSLPVDLKVKDNYPDIWWQPVPEDQLPGWEIPPQAADRSQGYVILSKRNELGQFSNLAPAEFVLNGEKFASVEGLWQGMKYPENSSDDRFNDPSIVWSFTREQVMQMSGFESKKAGDLANENMKKLGIKWVTYKGERIEYNGSGKDRHYQIILAASRAKIAQNEHLKKLLLSTGDLKFLPDHKQRPDSAPAYLYHEIYHKIREELKQKP